MEEGNVSSGELTIIHQQVYRLQINAVSVIQVTVILSTTLLFSFLNGIMFYILWSKPQFRESSRYILFAHMLFNDSVHLLGIVVLYLLAVAYVFVTKAVCALVVLITVVTYNNSPLNLAVISLERYVAIRFPLRHAEIATERRTKIAIGIMWLISFVSFSIHLLYILVADPRSFATPIICTREQMYIGKWQLALSDGLNVFYLVVVTVTIIFCYTGITLTAKSACTDKDSANKARKTVLLHLIQLGLCMASFVYALFEALIARAPAALFVHLYLLNFFSLIILPRCLSPLIYGLRDSAFRPLFLRFFRCNPSTVKPVLMTDKEGQ